jgi:AcrR family transcriptional regulator
MEGERREIGSNEPFSRALIDLCFERGFFEVSVGGLCERAGVDRAAFESRYTDLEDCFVQVYDELADQYLALVNTAFEGEQGWRNQLRAVAYATLRHIEEDPARANFTVVEAFKAGERAQLVRERVFETLTNLVDQGRLEAEGPGEISAATAQSLNGAVFQHLRTAVENPHQRHVDVLPELMYTIVLTYLGPEAAAEELEISQAVLVGAGEG